MNEMLTVRLGPKLAGALEAARQQTGISKGEIARQALEAHLNGSRKLAVMHHYFGTMRGPSDLSTNKAYRRNWKKRA